MEKKCLTCDEMAVMENIKPSLLLTRLQEHCLLPGLERNEAVFLCLRAFEFLFRFVRRLIPDVHLGCSSRACRSLFNCHLLREAFPDCPSYKIVPYFDL